LLVYDKGIYKCPSICTNGDINNVRVFSVGSNINILKAFIQKKGVILTDIQPNGFGFLKMQFT